MMLFKNFRIRRHLCDRCDEPSLVLLAGRQGLYRSRKYYCAAHEFVALYWSVRTGHKIYKDTGAAATSPLIAHIVSPVIGLPFTPTGIDKTCQWDAAGIFN